MTQEPFLREGLKVEEARKEVLKEIKTMGLLIECSNDGGYYFASENYLDAKTKEKCWDFFIFVGRLLGKAIYDRQMMELPFSTKRIKYSVPIGMNTRALAVRK